MLLKMIVPWSRTILEQNTAFTMSSIWFAKNTKSNTVQQKENTRKRQFHYVVACIAPQQGNTKTDKENKTYTSETQIQKKSSKHTWKRHFHDVAS